MLDLALSSRVRRLMNWSYAAVILGSVLAIGTLHATTLCVITVLLGIISAFLWVGNDGPRLRSAAKVLLFVSLGLTAFTAFQLVPLPSHWVARSSALRADVWARALHPLGETGPNWIPLTLDPVATKVQVGRGVAYTLALIAGLRIASRSEGCVFLNRTLMAVGAIVAVATLGHSAVEATKVFGIYKPIEGLPATGPLLNANHLGAFLNIAFCVALAEVLSREPTIPRPLLVVLLMLLAAVQVKAASRGGTASMLLACVLVPVMWRVGRARRVRLRAAWVPVGLMLVGATILFAFGGAEHAAADLRDTNLSKLGMFRQVVPMVRDFPLVGVGRGAFESTFPAYFNSTGFLLQTHPEDLPLQWLTEWGVPATLIAIAAIAWSLRPSVMLARMRHGLGAWAALVVVAIHNLVDFSSEVPGVVLSLVVCVAVVTGGSTRSRGAEEPTRNASGLAFPVLSGAIAALALLLVPRAVGHELNAERAALRDAAVDPSIDLVTFREHAHAAMLRHPAEPYLPLCGAMRALRSRGENVVPWIERALERSPINGPAHYLLARWLAPTNPSQARLEYRMAAEQFWVIAGQSGVESVPLVHSVDDALEAAPSGVAGIDALLRFSDALAPRRPASAARIDEEILRRRSTERAPLLRSARASVQDLQQGDAAPWCSVDRAACTKRALDAARALESAAPADCFGYLEEATTLVVVDRSREGLDMLARATDHVVDRAGCLAELARLSIVAHDESRATSVVEQLSRASCETRDECTQNFVTAAGLEMQMGNRRKALGYYHRASDGAPAREDLLQTRADLASELGLHAEALDAYQLLAGKHPSDARWTKAVERERHLVAREWTQR